MIQPLHSIVIPVLNGARFLDACLDSVLAQLGEADEAIVVDNGSTDRTLDLLAARRDPRLIVLHQPVRGISNARNMGLARAQGRLISFQDCDDLWPPGRQDVLMAALTDNPTANAAHGRQRVIFDGMPMDETYAAMDGQHVLMFNILTAMFRRELLDRVGQFDPSLAVAEDVDYLVRLRQAGMNAVAIDADVHIRRRHDANTTSSTPATAQRDTLQILRRNIVRRRTGD